MWQKALILLALLGLIVFGIVHHFSVTDEVREQALRDVTTAGS